jgi:hypothetical protein
MSSIVYGVRPSVWGAFSILCVSHLYKHCTSYGIWKVISIYEAVCNAHQSTTCVSFQMSIGGGAVMYTMDVAAIYV